MRQDAFPVITGGALIDMTKRLQQEAVHLSSPFVILHGLADGTVFPESSKKMSQESEVKAGRPNTNM